MFWDFLIHLECHHLVQQRWFKITNKCLMEIWKTYVPADVLASSGARTSAGTVMTKSGPCIHRGLVWDNIFTPTISSPQGMIFSPGVSISGVKISYHTCTLRVKVYNTENINAWHFQPSVRWICDTQGQLCGTGAHGISTSWHNV